jgi:hypothetical protein
MRCSSQRDVGLENKALEKLGNECEESHITSRILYFTMQAALMPFYKNMFLAALTIIVILVLPGELFELYKNYFPRIPR